MALPSARRPVDVEEDVQEEATQETPLRIKVSVDKVMRELFMETMVNWYSFKNPKKRLKVTNRDVINRAMEFCRKYKFPYESLPPRWLRDLYYDHNVQFKMKATKKKIPTVSAHEPQVPRQVNGLVESSIEKKSTKFDKKIIDLTDEPPPEDWVATYLTGEKVPPRQLKVVKNSEDVVVMYYEYSNITNNIKPEKDGRECFPTQPHDRDGVFR